MSHGLSPSTRALLEAAKGDAPSAAAKAEIWSGVATATGGAAGAGAGGAAAATAGAGKLVAAGALVGSAVTVGLAFALLRVSPSSLPPAPPPIHVTTPPPPGPRAILAPPPPPSAASSPALDRSSVPPQPAPVHVLKAPPPPSPAVTPVAKPAHARPSTDDALTRESLLVAEARGALIRGDAQAALAAIRAARSMDSHALEPEELSVEAKALRALGRDDEAASSEARLRAFYPDHALAR